MFVAWRDLRFASGRFALMGGVVTLITVLVVLLSGLTAGLRHETTSAIAGLPADHLVFSAPTTSQHLSFTESSVDPPVLRRWRDVPGVAHATGLGIASATASVGDRTAGVSAFGVSPGSRLAPGRIRPGGAILSVGAAEALGARRGQTVTIAGQRLAVTAIAGDASYSHTPVLWIDLAAWRHLAPGPGAATVIALTTTDTTALAAADRRLGTRTVPRADALPAIGSYRAENASLQLMRGLLLAISALVIGAFFTVWTIQRSGDVAVLKALGATTGYLLRDALGQAVVLLGAGTMTGTAIAAAAGKLASGAVPFVLDAGTVLPPAVAMIALGALGAGLSLRRIVSVDPLTALGAAR